MMLKMADETKQNIDETFKCITYNRTKCQQNKGSWLSQEKGCGSEYEICKHSDGHNHFKMCYGLWYVYI